MSILTAENVSFSYDKKTDALSGVSFSVEKGEYVSIIGHNGSGKSTLARLFNGLIKPDKGEITVCGYSSLDKKNLFEIRKRIGVVFQNPDNQLVASIVEDDVAFGPENLGIPRKEIGERIEFALKAVGMENYRFSSPSRLSGGQKQRIAIAGVLALKPQIIVLDESTSMLDPKGRKEITGIVRKLNEEENTTVISVTHFMEETVFADKIIVLNDGKVFMQGTPSEIFSQRETLKKIGLEVPYSTFLAEKLKEKGVPLKGEILTPEALAEAICELK